MTDPISKASLTESSTPDSPADRLKSEGRGQLFIVATPIGNLGDISQRALQVLAQVDCILAEDTRHSKRLLNHYGINQKLRSCHEHNEESLIDWVKAQLDDGVQLALISDAGTPLISDPGFVLVRALRESGYAVVALPGPSSIIAALSVAGLPTDGFVYDGFLPSKSSARQKALRLYLHEHRTIVLLESSHRIEACLKDVVDVLGASRPLVMARELTKRFETVLTGQAQQVLSQVLTDQDQTKGEFVLMLAGAKSLDESDTNIAQINISEMLATLIEEVPLKPAAAIVAKLTGLRKNDLYDQALVIKKARDA